MIKTSDTDQTCYIKTKQHPVTANKYKSWTESAALAGKEKLAESRHLTSLGVIYYTAYRMLMLPGIVRDYFSIDILFCCKLFNPQHCICLFVERKATCNTH